MPTPSVVRVEEASKMLMSVNPAAWSESAAVRPPIPAPAIRILGCELRYGILKQLTYTGTAIAIERQERVRVVRRDFFPRTTVPRFGRKEGSIFKYRDALPRPRPASEDRHVAGKNACQISSRRIGPFVIPGDRVRLWFFGVRGGRGALQLAPRSAKALSSRAFASIVGFASCTA